MTLHNLHEVNPFFQHAVAEHRDLHHAFEKVREYLAGNDPSQAHLVEGIRLLTELRDRLSQHFSQEEKGGYLEEAVTRLPRLEPQAAALQRQHGEFLDTVNELLRDARRPGTLPALWGGLRDGYTQLMKRLTAHETAENKLLQSAFNEDMGF